MEKIINLNHSVDELCTVYPELMDILKDLGFKDIVKPGMLQTAGRFMTIPKGAAMKNIDIEVVKLILKDKDFIIEEEV